jgi:hypothetical protein
LGTHPGDCTFPALCARSDRSAARRDLPAAVDSILISSFGGQVTLLALPLTAAVLLHASPTQMGLLTAMETAAVRAVLAADRRVARSGAQAAGVRGGRDIGRGCGGHGADRLVAACALSMSWLYVVGFVIGAVNTTAGSAAQVVLTQIVPRERLVEAHAKNALAQSTAEVSGPGAAGALIKLTGAPLALLADALLLLVSASILRGVPVKETPSRSTRASGPRCAKAWISCAATSCWSRWRAASAAGSCAARPPRWCRSCSRRACWA